MARQRGTSSWRGRATQALFLLCVILVALTKAQNDAETASTQQVSKSQGPPAFFLQDPTDGLCLAGGTYKRCSINTLWFVTGKPGSYSIHHRPVDEDDDDECFDKASCHLDDSAVKLADCNHCGAKKWNIVGDNESGYVLTEDNNKNCVKRVGDKAVVNKCQKGYSGLALHCKYTPEKVIFASFPCCSGTNFSSSSFFVSSLFTQSLQRSISTPWAVMGHG